MNICILDYDINPPWVEAVRILAYELSRQLVKQGHSVHIITSSMSTLPSEQIVDGIWFHRISRKLFLSYSLARKVRELHQRIGFDVIHIQNAITKKSFIVTLILLKKWVRTPLVSYICLQPTTTQKDFAQLWRLEKSPKYSPRIIGWLIGAVTPRFLVRNELNLVDKIVTSSGYLRNSIMCLGVDPRRIVTIYPFININEFVANRNCKERTRDSRDLREDLGFPRDTPLILYVGSTEPVRLGNFLKVMRMVLDKMPESKFVFLTSAGKEFLNSVHEYGLMSAAIVLPQNIEVDMRRLLSSSNVFVYPGLSGIVSIDPPLTLVEALVLGVPAVVSNFGGIPEIVKDFKNCLLVKTFDATEMANALIKLLKKSTMVFRSQGLLESHSLFKYESKVATIKFIDIYNDLIVQAR
jgi:glycosyltransferase involved in cell wall biosynthesis